MVISQPQKQQGEQQAAALKQHQGKPRKRRVKQQQQSQPPQSQLANEASQDKPILEAPIQTIDTKQKFIDSVQIDDKAINGKDPGPETKASNPETNIVPRERSTIKKQQVSKLLTKDTSLNSSTNRNTTVTVVATPAQVVSKNSVAEDTDDIDAGIELDGSSNSGSSVKDINEDQIKSNSVSPIMAQSNLINDASPAHMVQETEKICESSVCLETIPAKKLSSRKQLAANQQIIDADEQSSQEKLLNKQKKSQITTLDSKSNPESISPKTNLSASGGNDKGNSNSRTGENVPAAKVHPPLRRNFSSQSSQEAQDGGPLCKICDQHVYQMERMMAEKSLYHKKCFRCFQCKIQLNVNNYSSHEGQVYCKLHHRQIFHPQVKLDSEDDVDIVAKSRMQKRQMIICENEPAELPKDVIRSDTKVDDGIQQLNLNLNNILEKFERATKSTGEESQPSSAGIVIDKPTFNIKRTLMAFESKLGSQDAGEEKPVSKERPQVRKLTNISNFLSRRDSSEDESPPPAAAKPLPVTRSGSLMMRLKKYESRIAGEQVDDDDDDVSSDGEQHNDDNNNTAKRGSAKQIVAEHRKINVTGKLTSLKDQWESGDIIKRRASPDDDEPNDAASATLRSTGNGEINGVSSSNGHRSSLASEKDEELSRIRQQMAQRKLGESKSVKNIYENAVREAQLAQQQTMKRDSSDLSTLNVVSTTGIQQQLLKSSTNGSLVESQSSSSQPSSTTNNINKDHFQLNLSNKANILKKKFELGLINNSSHDDDDYAEGEEADKTPALTKMELIQQEKLEDLSILSEGVAEIKAREARNMFQQIDRRISAANDGTERRLSGPMSSRSLAAVGASMKNKLTSQMMDNQQSKSGSLDQQQQQQPIRLTNNVRS